MDGELAFTDEREESEIQESVDELTSTLQELSGLLDGDGSELAPVLQCLVEGAVRIVPDADMGSVTIVRDGRSETVVVTDPLMHDVDSREGGSLIASPLLLDDRVSGFFNVYSHNGDGFRTLDASLLDAFTTAAMVALRQAQRCECARRVVRHLEVALQSRASIDHAVGVVMALRGVGPQAAFDVLVRTSQESNIKLRDVAQQLLDRVDRT